MIKVWKNKYRPNIVGKVDVGGMWGHACRLEVIDNDTKTKVFDTVFDSDRDFYTFVETMLSFK